MRGFAIRARGGAVLVGLVLALSTLGAGSASGAASTSGDQLWVSSLRTGANVDHGTAVVAGTDSSKVFVTGYVHTSFGDLDYGTAAFDATTGAQLWAKHYDGGIGGDDYPWAIAISPDGTKIYVTGQSPGTGGDDDYATIAYSTSTGAVVWVSRYEGTGASFDEAQSVAASADGSKVFVTGRSIGSGTGYDYFTIVYDAATGSKLWSKRYIGPGGTHEEWAWAVAASPDSTKVFVTGHTGPTSTADYLTIGYDAATGVRLWLVKYNGPAIDGKDQPHGIAVNPDGSAVYVTGESQGTGSVDYATLAYATDTGSQLWLRRYNLSVQLEDNARSVAVSPNGATVFVTGWSETVNNSDDYLTLAYEAVGGATIWVKRKDGSATLDQAASVATSPDGTKAYVTGFLESDYGTIAYDATTGTKPWLSRYDGSAQGDHGAAAAVTPDGSKVFVTGDSYVGFNQALFTTVGYEG